MQESLNKRKPTNIITVFEVKKQLRTHDQWLFREVKVLKDFMFPTLRGQILSFWSSSPDPPQNHLLSSSLWSFSLSSSLCFSSSSSRLLRPGPGARSCWRAFRGRSSALTCRRLRRMNSSCGQTWRCEWSVVDAETQLGYVLINAAACYIIISFNMHFTVLLRHLLSKLVSLLLSSLSPSARGWPEASLHTWITSTSSHVLYPKLNWLLHAKKKKKNQPKRKQGLTAVKIIQIFGMITVSFMIIW